MSTSTASLPWPTLSIPVPVQADLLVAQYRSVGSQVPQADLVIAKCRPSLFAENTAQRKETPQLAQDLLPWLGLLGLVEYPMKMAQRRVEQLFSQFIPVLETARKI